MSHPLVVLTAAATALYTTYQIKTMPSNWDESLLPLASHDDVVYMKDPSCYKNSVWLWKGTAAPLQPLGCNLVAFTKANLTSYVTAGGGESLVLLCSDKLLLITNGTTQTALQGVVDPGSVYRPGFISYEPQGGFLYVVHKQVVHVLEPGFSLVKIGSEAVTDLATADMTAVSRDSQNFIETKLKNTGLTPVSGMGLVMYPTQHCYVASVGKNYGEINVLSGDPSLKCTRYKDEAMCKVKEYWCEYTNGTCVATVCEGMAVSTGQHHALSFTIPSRAMEARDLYLTMNPTTNTQHLLVEEYKMSREVVAGPDGVVYFLDVDYALNMIRPSSVSEVVTLFVPSFTPVTAQLATTASLAIVRYHYKTSSNTTATLVVIAKGKLESTVVLSELSRFTVPGGFVPGVMPLSPVEVHGRVYLTLQANGGGVGKDIVEIWGFDIGGTKQIRHDTVCGGNGCRYNLVKGVAHSCAMGNRTAVPSYMYLKDGGCACVVPVETERPKISGSVLHPSLFGALIAAIIVFGTLAWIRHVAVPLPTPTSPRTVTKTQETTAETMMMQSFILRRDELRRQHSSGLIKKADNPLARSDRRP